MKNILFSLTALFLFFSVASCKKDNDTNAQEDSTFSCKVNGASFSVKGFGAYATTFSGYFVIYGVADVNNSNSETIYLSLPAGITQGTHNLDANDHVAYYIDAAQNASSTAWGPSSGTVTIDEIDAAHVKGTFQFIAYDSSTGTVKKTISEGKFNVVFR